MFLVLLSGLALAGYFSGTLATARAASYAYVTGQTRAALAPAGTAPGLIATLNYDAA